MRQSNICVLVSVAALLFLGAAPDEKPKAEPPTLQQAAAIIQAEREARATACYTELLAVLKKHRCEFDISVILRSGSIEPRLSVIAKD